MIAPRLRVPTSPRAEGFTLLEVTIATGLLVVIALGSAQLFLLAIRHTQSARQQLVMTLVAARKIDELCAGAAAAPIPLSPPDALERDDEGFADVTVESGLRCARRWLVSVVPGYGGAVIAVGVRVRVQGGGDVQIVTSCQVAVS